MRSVAIGRSRPLISKNLYEQKLNGSAEKVDVGLQTAAELGIINNESSELDTIVKPSLCDGQVFCCAFSPKDWNGKVF